MRRKTAAFFILETVLTLVFAIWALILKIAEWINFQNYHFQKLHLLHFLLDYYRSELKCRLSSYFIAFNSWARSIFQRNCCFFHSNLLVWIIVSSFQVSLSVLRMTVNLAQRISVYICPYLIYGIATAPIFRLVSRVLN